MDARDGAAVRASAAALAAAMAVGACGGSAVHNVQRQRPAPIAVPDRFAHAAAGLAPSPAATPASGGESAPFWQSTGLSGAAALCQRALAGNLDLLRARARLAAAEAVVRSASAALHPQLSFEGSVSHQQQNLFLGSRGGPTGSAPITVTQTIFPTSLAASYEVDVWGRVAATRQAAVADAQATAHDAAAMEVTLAASVLEGAITLVAERAGRALLTAQHDATQRVLEALEKRFQVGALSHVDLLQQRSQLEAIDTQVPAAESRVRLAVMRLQVLLGGAPTGAGDELGLPAALPPLPALPALGVPSELLARRPDIRAAQARLLAVDHRLGAAKADLLPSLRLSGSTGFTGRTNPLSFLDNFVFNLGAALSAPLWDGGRRRAEIARVQATLQDAVWAYGQVVQRALTEVEEALVRERAEVDGLRLIEARIATLQLLEQEAAVRHRTGQTDYLPVLQAQAALQTIEAERIQRQRALWLARVGLWRALASAPEVTDGAADGGPRAKERR